MPSVHCRTAPLLCQPPTTLNRKPMYAGLPCEAPWDSPRASPRRVLGRAMCHARRTQLPEEMLGLYLLGRPSEGIVHAS